MVTAILVTRSLPTITEVTNRYNVDNSKNDLMVDTEYCRVLVNVYTKEYKNHMKDERQWKMENREIYNIVL